MAATPITTAQAGALLQGLQALAGAGHRVDTQAQVISQPLPVLVQPASKPGGNATPTSIGMAAPLGDFLTHSLLDTAQTYLAGPDPTVEGLGQALSGAVVGDVTAGIAGNMLTIDLKNIAVHDTRNLGIDLGVVDPFYDASADPTASPVPLGVDVSIPELTLNLVLNTNQFFTNTPAVQYRPQSAAFSGGLAVDLGFLKTTLGAGSIQFTPDPTHPVQVAFFDPNGTGELTTAELRDPNLPIFNGGGALGLDVSMALYSKLGAFQTNPAHPPTVAIHKNNLFDSSPASGRVLNFAQIEPFTAIEPDTLTQLINVTADAIDRFAQSPALGSPLPFVQGLTVGGSLALGNAIRTSLFDKLTRVVTDPTTGTTTLMPTFRTAQELADQLATILQVPASDVNPRFDPATKDLTFTVRFHTANPARNVPFSVMRNDLGLELQTSRPTETINSSSTLQFTIGATLVDTIAAQIKAQALAQADGRLSGDAHFTLATDGGAPVAVTLPASATLDNRNALDLVNDLNAAIRSAGITSVVAGLDTPNPTLSGTIPAPFNGQLDGDAHFRLTIDNHAPITVTVPRSATRGNANPRQLVNAFNASLKMALQGAGLPGNLVAVRAGKASQVLYAGMPIPANGQLSGDSHFTLTLPATATLPTTIAVVVTQAATLNNKTPQDMVADFNTAIHQALANAKLSATTIGASLGGFGQQVVGTLPVPSTGQLGGDAHFALSINGGSPVAVSVLRATTVQNRSAQDLVAEFNQALTAAGLGSIVAKLIRGKLGFVAGLGLGIKGLTLSTGVNNPMTYQLGFTGGQRSVAPPRLLIATGLANDIRSLTLDVAANDPMVTQLGFLGTQLAASQPVLTFFAPSPGSFRLLKFQAATGDPTVTQLGFANGQTAGSLDGALTLTAPTTSGATFLRLGANRSDPAVTQLGFDDGQAGATITKFGRALTDRTFIQGASIAGSVSLQGPAASALSSGRFGFLGTQVVGGTVTASASVQLQLKDPHTGTPGGRISPSELLDAVGPESTTGHLTAGSPIVTGVTPPPGGLAVGQTVTGIGIPLNTTVMAIRPTGPGATVSLVLSAPATASSPRTIPPDSTKAIVVPTSLAFTSVLGVTTTPTMTGSGSAALTLRFPNFGGQATVPLGIEIGSIADPVRSLTLDTSGMGNYARFQFVDYDDVLSGFQMLARYLQQYSAFHDPAGMSPLTFNLPTLGRNVTQLDDYAGTFTRFVAALSTLDVVTTQDFQQQATSLLGGYGLSARITPTLSASGPTPSYAIAVGAAFNTGTLESRFDLGHIPTLVKLSGGSVPNLAGVSRLVDTSVAPNAVMTTQVGAALNLSLGLDLSNPRSPRPFLKDGPGLVTVGTLSSGSGLAFPVSLGKLGLYITGGTAFVNGDGKPGSTRPATITLGLAGDPSGRNYFDANLLARSSASLTGKAGASLPVSLTPTTNPSPTPISIPITRLSGVLDGVVGSVAPIQAPSLQEDYDLIKLIQNTPGLTSGLNQYILDLQNLLNAQVFGRSYPVVGGQLLNGGQFLEQFRVILLNQLLNDVQSPQNPIALIQESLALILGPGGLGWLVDAHGNPATTPAQALADINISLPGQLSPGTSAPAGDFVDWNFHLQTQRSISNPQLQVGLPALQMAFQAGQSPINVGMTADLYFNFGVNTKDGFYVDTTVHNPLTVAVDARPVANTTYSGTYGYFNVTAVPDLIASKSGKPTEFQGTFTVGVADSARSNGTVLPYTDLLANDLQISPTLQATGVVDLSIKTHPFGISTVFDMQWNFASTDPDLSGSQPKVAFRRIGTAWADSVTNFLGPNFKRIFDFLDTGRLGSILDFIEKPLPVFDYFISGATTIDVIGLLSGPAYPAVVGFFDLLEFLRSIYRSVPTAFDPRYNLSINQGSFTITQDLRKLTSLSQITTKGLVIDNSGVTPFIDQVFAYESKPKNKDFTTAEDGGVISGSLTNRITIGIKNASLTIPFFEDPDDVKLMLLGCPGDLLRVITPSLGVSVKGQITFPPIPIGPLDLKVFTGGELNPSIQFGFGYDTRGLSKASSGGGSSDVSDGFYFIANQTYFDMMTKFYLGIGAGIPDIASVGLRGYLLWDNRLALRPTVEDKVYLDHFSGLVDSGSLQVGAELTVRVLVFKKSITIAKPHTIFAYGNGATGPILARSDGGTLRLNVGPDAPLRQSGDATDGDESYTIRHIGGTRGHEDVAVSAFGVTQVYRDVRMIVADTGRGNDAIVVEPGVLADADLIAGPGRDRLVYRGLGSANLRGGVGPDDLEATGPGTSVIVAGSGNDTLVGGRATTIRVGGGNHTIAGVAGTTVIASGSSSYSLSDQRLMSGSFSNTLRGIRRVVLNGTDGADVFRVDHWSGSALLDGHNGFDSFTIRLGGGGTTDIRHSGPIGRNRVRIIGTPGADEMTIADTRTTSGRDVVRYGADLESLSIMGGGGDHVFRILGGAEGLTEFLGGPGRDTLDVLATRPFSRTTFAGGAGDDTVRIGAPAGGRLGAIRGGMALDGGTGTNHIIVDVSGNLDNLLQFENFAPDATVRVRGDLTHAVVADARAIRVLSIGGTVAPLGMISARDVAALAIGGDLAGTVRAAGTIGSMDVAGSVRGTIRAGRLNHLAIGGGLTGSVGVAGRLERLDVGGALTGHVKAGSIGLMNIATPCRESIVDALLEAFFPTLRAKCGPTFDEALIVDLATLGSHP